MDKFTIRDWEFMHILVSRRLRYEEKRGLKFNDEGHAYKIRMMRALVAKLKNMVPISVEEKEAAYAAMEDYSDE